MSAEHSPIPEGMTATDFVRQTASQDFWLPLHDSLEAVIARAENGEFADYSSEEYKAVVDLVVQDFINSLKQ
jgi:hypothetical protein